MRLVAGLDVGTTSIRAGLFDEAGRRIATKQQRLSISFPFDGGVEQDPVEIRDVAVSLLVAALSEADAAAEDLVSIGIANQRGTVVAWDRVTGMPLRPAIGWQDTRTAERVAEFRANGIPLNTSASCSKIEWLLQHDEQVKAARTAGTLRLGTIDTWLTSALTSESAFVTDPSNAGATGFYDPGSGDWSEFVVEMFGADTSLLAKVEATNALAGSTPVDLLGTAVPVTARAGDQQAASFSHGLSVGEAKLTLGTSGMLDLSTGADVAAAPDGTYALPLWRLDSASVPDQFCIEGSVNTAGSIIEWLVAVGLLSEVSALDQALAESRNPVHFVPALSGLGSPALDPGARGIIGEIGRHTSAADLVAGAVQGIAARVAAIANTIKAGDIIIADGGLSRSRRLLAAVADLTGRVAQPGSEPEPTPRRAALPAATAGGRGVRPAQAARPEPIEPSISADQRQSILSRYSHFEAAARRS